MNQQERDEASRQSETPVGLRSRCCGGPIGRRTFIKVTGLGAVGAVAAGGLGVMAGPFTSEDTRDHHIPVDKKLHAEWLKGLFERGGPAEYSGTDLETIGMPIGGVCAGQLYLAGDGRLVCWQISNETHFTGYGATNYEVGRRPEQGLQQGFALRVQSGDEVLVRSLDCEGFPGVRFCGEYPIGTVTYEDEDFPVAVKLEAYSPFIPLDASDSGLPATVMQFKLKNTTAKPLDVTLAGWLENGVSWESATDMHGVRMNQAVQRDGLSMVLSHARSTKPASEPRPPIVLADFEEKDYGDWAVEGEAFGTAPAEGTLRGQQKVSGFSGKGLVNTFLGGDKPHGKLTSPVFKIERSFISFLVGGGNHKGKTCINLIVNEKIVHTAEGANKEKLQWHNWDVHSLAGQEARIEIVDQESGGWGHVNIDRIELRDTARSTRSGPLETQPDFGTMGLALLDSGEGVLTAASLADGAMPQDLFAPDGGLASSEVAEKSFGESLVGGVGKRLRLEPGKEANVTFLVVWHYANRPDRGQFYATRFNNAVEVATYIAGNFERLAGETRLWHDTWYDSTLPHWLLDRLFSTVSTLASGTCQRWANGRFWAWEGVGCCHGTCTHVWNYEHAMARLFPQLERSAREMQDYNAEAGFVPETGMVRFRGEGWNMWAADGQAGTVLKAYREHLISADDAFLKRLWPRIRKSLEFLINEDKNDDGLIEGSQHNTYDINFQGANTMVGSLYLAALRAGEEMAREMGDTEFATRCRKIFESGRKLSVERLFNGEYFVQEVDLQEYPKHQYGDGCLADQLFGQGWAHQVRLGYIYPQANVQAALASIWRYDWAPDVGPQNAAHPPQRWFARPGEAGLFTCTWPKSKHLGPESVLYRDEVWTGIEYQVAGNMVWDGMVTEALAICRAIHERYHPSKHNPFNEIECGDHYARGMASYGVFLALCGFEYHGPKAYMGFTPQITPDDFRAAFVAAEGWGTISQKRQSHGQSNRIAVKWGQLRVESLAFELPRDTKLQQASAMMAGQPLPITATQDGSRVTVLLSQPAVIEVGQDIAIQMSC